MHTRREFVVRAPAAPRRGCCVPWLGAEPGRLVRRRLGRAGLNPGQPPGPLRRVSGAVLQCDSATQRAGVHVRGSEAREAIQPGTRIVTWTEDCFDGLVKTSADLPGKVMPPGHDNPQTGPFYVEGAAPGDTLAIHILNLTPARTWAVSSVTRQDRRPRRHQPDGNARTGLSRDDVALRGRRSAHFSPHDITLTESTRGQCPFAVPRMSARALRPPARCARRSYPGPWRQHGRPEVRAGNTIYLGVNMPRWPRLVRRWALRDGRRRDQWAAVEGAMNGEVVVDLVEGEIRRDPAHWKMLMK